MANVQTEVNIHLV